MAPVGVLLSFASQIAEWAGVAFGKGSIFEDADGSSLRKARRTTLGLASNFLAICAH